MLAKLPLVLKERTEVLFSIMAAVQPTVTTRYSSGANRDISANEVYGLAGMNPHFARIVCPAAEST